MKFDRCEYCKGAVKARRVTVDLRRGKQLCVFRNVTVGVCGQCGERYYPGPVLERPEELARHGINGSKTIKVPTFDYAVASRA